MTDEKVFDEVCSTAFRTSRQVSQWVNEYKNLLYYARRFCVDPERTEELCAIVFEMMKRAIRDEAATFEAAVDTVCGR